MSIETFFYVLWAEPLVCVISAGGPMEAGLELALSYAGGRPCHILARPSWALSIIGPDIAEAERRLRAEQPAVRLVALAPTPQDVALMQGLGVETLWAHNSAFLDERVYFPEPGAPKLFDAVHTAQTKSFKRHELAYGVPRLALITYAERQSEVSVAELAGRYHDLGYVNWSAEGGFRNLGAGDVRAVISRARCGLLLSEVEGPNSASMEYFLCGLPLVTTAGAGGREAMYDPRHVVVVEPNAAAVEDAVAGFRSRAPDPGEIRRSALATARPHRLRLIDWLSGIVETDLRPHADENGWLPQFRDKLRQKWRVDRRSDGGLEARPLADPGAPTLQEA